MENPFELFGLPETATVAEVKAKWRQLAAELHPDHGGSAEKFMEYRQAYNDAVKLAEAGLECPDCFGTGKMIIRTGFSQMKLVCPRCGGDGTITRG